MTPSATLEDLAAFNDQLAALVSAGIPLAEGLQDLAEAERGQLAHLYGRLAERLRGGASLDEALAEERQSIPPVYRAVVTAGLKSGRLPAALESLTTLALELREIRRQIGQALLQPLILGLLAYVLLVVFGLDLLARYRDTFDQFEIRPEWPLPWLFTAGDWLGQFWWVAPLVLLLLLAGWHLTGRAGLLSLSGWSAPLALVPGVAAVVRNYRYASFSQILALLCEHGVPLGESVRLAASATDHPPLRVDAEHLARATEQGAQTIPRGHWPQFLHWTLTSGARRDGLPKLLRHAATLYRRRGQTCALWLRTGFPLVCTIFLGGSIVLAHALIHLGPMAALWWNLGRN